ncbi:MAG: PAAR domain-containing protein [Burkholderiaceae bacterium]|nr:PAAR domain-containing protein [Burkholderiaceae bacterium]
MADMREALKHGDVTTTGGRLISSAVGFEHDGVEVGQEGDLATCPACGTMGKVFNDAYPSFTLQSGLQILVRGAKVMCQCETKPLVIPSQHNFKIEVNRQGAGASAERPVYSQGSARNGVDGEIIEQYYELLGDDGQPIDGYRYDLFSDEDQFVRNSVMTNGRTVAVTGDRHLRIVMWLDKKGQVRA